MKTKIKISGIIVLALALVLFATAVLGGCAPKQTVNITGSTSVAPLMKKLAAAFEEQNKNIRISVGAGGSSQGIKDTQDGKNDIGMSSRAVKDSETGVTVKQIAYDGVAVIINKNATVSENNVTNAQVYDLYAAGTPIGDISLAVSREEGSGTRDAFDELVTNADGDKLADLTAFASVVGFQNSTDLIITEVAGNVKMLGYISMGSLGDSVKAVKFNGVEPTAANVKNGSYSLVRPFVLVTKEGSELSEAARAFIEFIMSEEGQKIVADNGYVPM